MAGQGLYERAESIAAEHCQWARAVGYAPKDVIRDVEQEDFRSPDVPVDWDDAVIYVGRAWLRLRNIHGE